MRYKLIYFALTVLLIAGCNTEGPTTTSEPFPFQKKDFGWTTEAVDLDKYESVFHVSAKGSDEKGDGSKQHPFATLQAAVNKATGASESAGAVESARLAILVSSGTYSNGAVQMKEYLDLYGGFDPLSWERDILVNKTELSGRDNSRILIGADHCRIDGFFITGGHYRGNGGAVYCEGTSPEISNNYFWGNLTLKPIPWEPDTIHEKAHDGGAVYACNGASPIIRNNIFSGNETENGRGGAVAFHGNCKGSIQNNVFLNNTVGLDDAFRSSDGGAVSIFDWCNTQLVDNLFIGNRALSRNDGGGLFVALWSSALVEGNYFFNNEAMDDAGGLFVGGQEHRYFTPLDPLPPADKFFVTVNANCFMGNHNSSNNSGAFRITMESRGDLTNNLVAFNNTYFQRSDLGIFNNTILGDFLMIETKEGLNPSRMKNTIVRGNISIDAPVEISYCILDSLSEDGVDGIEFSEGELLLQVVDVIGGDYRAETHLLIQGSFETNVLKNRVIKAGNRFSLIKQNNEGEIIIWDDLTSENEFVIMPLFVPLANSPVIDAGTEVTLKSDLYGNPRPEGEGYDIGAVETK